MTIYIDTMILCLIFIKFKILLNKIINYNMPKRFIFIPVVNHFDLLEKAINSVPNGLFNDYFIFNNSGKKIPIDTKHFTVIDRFGRLTFKQTQNAMREYAIINNYDYYCFMHNDGEVIDNTVERLINFADNLINQKVKWSAIFTNYDVLCAYSTECVKKIGKWGDSKWLESQQSGYYLDNDYYRRMQLSTYRYFFIGHKGVLHNEFSNTVKDETERRIWDEQREIVVKHYIQKWGGLPGEETVTDDLTNY